MGKQENPFSSTNCKLLSPNPKQRNYILYLLLFVIGLSVGVVCTLYFLSFSSVVSPAAVFTLSSDSSQPFPPPPPPPLDSLPLPPPPYSCNHTITTSIHNLNDKDLLRRASTVSKLVEPSCKFDIVPKVAFMFLTPGSLPLAPLWELFFKGHQGLYSIHVHPHPSYKDSWPPNSVFYRRRIPSKPVSWGRISMVDAERRLLSNALLDISNQRFVLLSDSCIPVFNFTTVYNYLMNSDLSFLGSFDDPKKPGRGRYNPQMQPAITIQQWRKGAQWFEVRRDLAIVIVSDQKYYDIFRRYCVPPCYNDEHYLPTMVNIVCPEMSSNRSVTRVDWSRGGPHPRKYGRAEVSCELLAEIRRRSYCKYNGEANAICFLFARKFLPDTIRPLLRVAPLLLGFDH